MCIKRRAKRATACACIPIAVCNCLIYVTLVWLITRNTVTEQTVERDADIYVLYAVRKLSHSKLQSTQNTPSCKLHATLAQKIYIF